MEKEDIDRVCKWIIENTHYTTFERVSNFGIKIDDIRLVFDYDSHAEVIEAFRRDMEE